VIIVGSGYTGLRAGIELLRAGRSVLVLDKEDPGFGASRRNAGYLGRTLKKSFSELVEKKGLAHASAVYGELGEALATTFQFIADEGIDCHAARCGRYIAAANPRHLTELETDLAVMKRHMGFDFHVVPRGEQRSEFACDRYFGGVVIPDLGSLHPGLYHAAMLALFQRLGGVISGRTPVLGVSRTNVNAPITVRTATGVLEARDVILATNGYTTRELPWHARRLVPFTGYIAATAPMPDKVTAAIPHGRTVIDTNINIDFFRPSPDGTRLVFGGSTASGLTEPQAIAARLQSILAAALPQLADTPLSHVWTGQCAGTFDMMPHIGGSDGVWYGMGYNFAGVPMGTYFGMKIAQMILGRPEGRSVFGEGAFPTMPFYRGNPWFMPYVMRYFDWKDGKRRAG
jgi:glycine/D-amino acid oxidase-like deaminating enzyme